LPTFDHYQILGVPPEASVDEIQRAYRALCKQYHPDTGLPEASEQMMKAINEAYRVLVNSGLRRDYDRRQRGVHSQAVRPTVRRSGDYQLVLGPDLIMPLARVPAGEFLMGGCSPAAISARPESSEAPQYTVYLPEYYIGIYTVTVAEYAAFVSATGRRSTLWARRSDSYDPTELAEPPAVTRLDRSWQHPFGAHSSVEDKPDHPVVVVDWYDATAFCTWATRVSGAAVRLPSTIEWQKAARGVDGRCYPWGDGPGANPHLCNCRRAGTHPEPEAAGDTTPVGGFSPRGDSPFGCSDMLGNVWEWTSTRARNGAGIPFGHPYRLDDGREDPDARDDRVLMGGSFLSTYRSVWCGVEREQNPMRPRDTGFRVCVAA
jgi:formylglycine-generating enzyme required for sulfatase activity